MDKYSKGIKYTVTIKNQKVCKPWTNPGKGHQVHSHNQDPKGQIQEKGIKYTVTIKTQKVCKPWTNLLGKGHQVHCHNQDQKGM